jgi:hypothetical protein
MGPGPHIDSRNVVQLTARLLDPKWWWPWPRIIYLVWFGDFGKVVPFRIARRDWVALHNMQRR